LNRLLTSLRQVLDLRWGEPLLRLASDVSRGMAYLHGREYLDETDQNKLKRCILHRDLKVATNGFKRSIVLKADAVDFMHD